MRNGILVTLRDCIFVTLRNCIFVTYGHVAQEDICKPGGHLTYFCLPSPYDTPCFCISGFLFSNIIPSRSLAWLKSSPQSHLMSKTSYNNTTTITQLRVPFSLSRQWYQFSPPSRIHFAPYSN